MKRISIAFLDVSEEKYQELANNETRNKLFNSGMREQIGRDFVLFQNGECSFLLAHGSEEGYIQINGDVYTCQQVINWLAPKAKKQGIDMIYTLSCYGGNQLSVESKGVTMKSFHPSKLPIFSAMLMEGIEFYFDVTEDELDGWNIPENIGDIEINVCDI